MTQSIASNTASHPPAPEGPRARVRWRFPVIVLLLLLALLAYLYWFSSLAGGFRFWGGVAAAVLAMICWIGWVLFSKAIPMSLRLTIVGAPLGVMAALWYGTRVDQWDGQMIPVRWVPAWWPEPDEELAGDVPSGPVKKITVAAAPGDSPHFLGPHRDGVFDGPRLASDWEASPPKKLWDVKIGAGWSSFAVVGEAAYTQEQRGPLETVSCYHLTTGKPVWFHTDEVRFASSAGGDGPRATPTVAEGRVYSVGGTGVVNCLDAATGKRLWSRNAIDEFSGEVPIWGNCGSPLLVENLVVVTGGGGGSPSLIAFDKETGHTAWTADWSADHKGTIADCYASPVLATLCGRRQILNLEDRGLASYDPAAGKQLWRHDWPWGGYSHPKAAQPQLLPGNRVFISAAYSSGCAIIEVLTDEQGEFSTRLVEKAETMKTKFSNVVRRGDYYYGLDQRILACIDSRTLQRKWKGGRYGHGAVLLAGDLLLVQIERPGDVALVKATPEGHRQLSRIEALDDITWNVPTLAGRYLLVRNDRQAVCFELPLAEQ